jgi:hypothetical protein
MADTNTDIHFSMKVDRLHCGIVRLFLESEQERGVPLSFVEDNGFFEREFTVRGPLLDMVRVREQARQQLVDICLRQSMTVPRMGMG